MSTLVIVESPVKRTIRNYLPAGYRVEASGHVRLPPSADEILRGKNGPMGVNVDADFEPCMLFPRIKESCYPTQRKR